MNAPIEVLDIKVLDRADNLKAFAKVRVGCIIISGCRIVQQPGQKAWVSMPANKSGEKWYPVVEITNRAVMDDLSTAVLDAWLEGEAELLSKAPQPLPFRGQRTWDKARHAGQAKAAAAGAALLAHAPERCS